METVIALRRYGERAWRSLLGAFSRRRRFVAEFLSALERGEGSVVFLWFWDGPDDYAADVAGLLADVDDAVRHAPAPLGADEMFIHVARYGPRPEDRDSVEPTGEGRKLLGRESLHVDRYYDWIRGEASRRLREILLRTPPSQEAPLVAIGVYPFGGTVAALLQSGRWQPVSPWLQ
jgi:hypothetical protein